METVQSVINEIMFIAMSKPDAFELTVEYSGISDSIHIRALSRDLDCENLTAESYDAAILFKELIFLGSSVMPWLNGGRTQRQAVLDAKNKILELMVIPRNSEVAA